MIKFQGAIFLPTHGLSNATYMYILDYTAKNDIQFVIFSSLSLLDFMNEGHNQIKRLKVLTFFLFTVHVSTLHNVIFFYKIEICY